MATEGAPRLSTSRAIAEMHADSHRSCARQAPRWVLAAPQPVWSMARIPMGQLDPRVTVGMAGSCATGATTWVKS